MKITDAKSFGKAIRAKRKEQGMTQSEMAAFTGFSVSFISDLENGKPTAELERSIMLANILGLDIELNSR